MADSKDPRDEAPVELEEARRARELAEAMDGRGDAAPEELADAARIAAARAPELSGRARDRIAGELFAPAATRRRQRWPWAVAAAAAIAVGALAVLQGRLPTRVEPRERSPFHDQAQVLVADLMPQPTPALRARAIGRAAAGRIQRGVAP